MDAFFTTRNFAIFLLLGVFSSIGLQFTGAQSIGVCYGSDGNDLPSKEDVVNLYKSNGIGKMRMYHPDEDTLHALRGSNIEVILGVPNDQLQSLTNAGAATDWVNKYIKPYSNDVNFKYIAVGNEVRPGDAGASFVLRAMQNIQRALSAANLLGEMKVSTAIDSSMIQNSYPPNNGAFTDSDYMKPMIDFLSNTGAPLLANVYPYFAYTGNPQSITTAYALFTQHGNNDAGYQNLFDAMMDSMYAALEKVGAPNMEIVVSESGWPCAGGDAATLDNASTYYKNLINHVKGGTPKRPHGPIETYLFAMFDEDLKPGAETERHFGLFRPNKSPKYRLTFN